MLSAWGYFNTIELILNDYDERQRDSDILEIPMVLWSMYYARAFEG